jgi:hypothetical protein
MWRWRRPCRGMRVRHAWTDLMVTGPTSLSNCCTCWGESGSQQFKVEPHLFVGRNPCAWSGVHVRGSSGRNHSDSVSLSKRRFCRVKPRPRPAASADPERRRLLQRNRTSARSRCPATRQRSRVRRSASPASGNQWKIEQVAVVGEGAGDVLTCPKMDSHPARDRIAVPASADDAIQPPSL